MSNQLSHPSAPIKGFLKLTLWGARATQSVKRLALDVGSGHDLTIDGIKPLFGLYPDSEEPAWDSLSPFLSFLHTLALSKEIKFTL